MLFYSVSASRVPYIENIFSMYILLIKSESNKLNLIQTRYTATIKIKQE